jgi:transcriptional regulator with XRE-family HTH domain
MSRDVTTLPSHTLYIIEGRHLEGSMGSRKLSDVNLALTVLRSALDWNQAELARAAGLSPNAVSDFERGKRPLSLDKLKDLAEVLGLPPESVTQARTFVRSMRQQAQAPGFPDEGSEGDHRLAEQFAVQAGHLVADVTRQLFSAFTHTGRSLGFRQQARVLWQRMQRRGLVEWRAQVEGDPEFRSWGLCELVCKESIRAAADSADRARELAELALLIAELAPGEASWRMRLQGYAWAHLGNARRVGGDLPGAEEAFAHGVKLWEDGATGDPGLLDEAQMLSLEASLRIDQCRLQEANTLLDRALKSASSILRPNLLIKKARALEWSGAYEQALRTLDEATPIIFQQDEPRLHHMLRMNTAWNLTHLARYQEAETLLPEARKLTAQLGNELDTLRLRWLEGRISAGLERTGEALGALSNVRAEFAQRGIAYDAALVTLELAALYLEQRRNREVRDLARQMAPIFRAQGVHREALAALRLFCEAAEKEAATVELAQRVVEYLYRARHNPALRFEANR